MHQSFGGSSVKITDQIWQVGGNSLTGGDDAAVYLVGFKDCAAIIDAGCGRHHHRLVENIESCLGKNPKISHLFLTHCHYDHTGGAKAIQKEYGCRIVCHHLDAVFLETGDSSATAASWYGSVMDPFAVDMRIHDSETRVPVGNGEIICYHCPGHSPGSMVFLVERAGRKILFGQDIHGPLHSMLLSNREDYVNSLKFIMDLEADVLCEGHFGIFYGKNEVRGFIGPYILTSE